MHSCWTGSVGEAGSESVLREIISALQYKHFTQYSRVKSNTLDRNIILNTVPTM